MSGATLSSNEWRYKALRIAVGDHKRRFSRQKLDQIGKRANPREWSHYIVANMVASILFNQEPQKLFAELLSEMTFNDRKPGIPRFYDSSRTKIGRQSLKNRVGETASMIKEDWCVDNISKDRLRVIFKKSFFSYFTIN